MCFDSTTSAITFSIATLSSIYLYYSGNKKRDNNDKFFSLIIFLIGLMQLIEYFLWKNQICNTTNHVFSILIIVLLTLQPILITNWYYYYLVKDVTFISQFFLLAYTCIFSTFIMYLIYGLNKSKLCSMPTKNSCRLQWDSIKVLSEHRLFFIIGLFLYFFPFFCLMYDFLKRHFTDFKKYPIRHLYLPASWVLTILYILNKNNERIIDFFINPSIFIEYVDVWGSLWCFSAIFLGIVAVLEI